MVLHLNLFALSEKILAVYRSWWFDPLIASLSFFSSIMIYSYYELKEGKSCYRNWSEFLWGRGIDKADTRPSLTMSLFAYWVGILIWVQLVPPPFDGDVHNDATFLHQLFTTKNDIATVATATAATAATAAATVASATANQISIPDGLPSSFQSIIYLLSEVISGIVLYDTIFFFIHFAMHECKFIASLTQHFEHHKVTKNLEARHVLRHSLMDGILQVLVNISVQRRTPWGRVKSRFARCWHNVFVTMMLTESHTASSYPNFFRWWCVGVREHRNHHLNKYYKLLKRNDDNAEGRKGSFHFHRYQQFFGHWDYLRLQYMMSSSSEFLELPESSRVESSRVDVQWVIHGKKE